jgi:DtxR family Mn-dependent transcriptional regulator
MVDPGTALLVFTVVVLAAAVLVWPGEGLVWRVVRRLREDPRETTEDGLKHLYKAHRFGRTPTLESLAGAVGIPTGRAAQLLDRMQEAGLVRADNPLELTDEGVAYALQVIRTHRLWERFLADRTGVAPGAWHAEAEAREHRMSPDEVEALAARLGHPRYDPHGDPIPTASGEIPEPVGHPLSELAPGAHGTVVHLEDEPHSLFDRLIGAGLHPGMRVHVRNRDGRQLELVADGHPVHLDAVAAGNVTVELDDGSSPRPGAGSDPLAAAETLVDLEPGSEAEVLGLSPACQGIQRRRLLDLGVVPGTRITAELSSAARDPVAYRIRGALIALRRDQQRWVRIRRPDAEAA